MLLATCGEDTNVRLWGHQQGSSSFALQTILTGGHTRTVRSVGWSPCGQKLASASFDGTVCVWDRRASKDGQFECSATLEGHENEVKCVSWSPSGQNLATCSRDKSVWVWDIVEEGEDDEFECAAVLQAHVQDVKKVQWHPLASVLASCSYDNTVKLFREDDDDWSCFATLTGHESTVWAIAFDAQGRRLATVSDDRSLRIFRDVGEDVWKCCNRLSGFHDRTIYDVDWCHSSGLIATACGDDAIMIFKEDEEKGTVDQLETNFSLVASVSTAHTQDVNSVAWNPKTEGLLASCSDDGDVKLWQIQQEDP